MNDISLMENNYHSPRLIKVVQTLFENIPNSLRMKNISFLLVVAFFILAHAAWAQPTFYVSPDFQQVDQGDQVCFTIKTKDFSNLLSVKFDISYDAGVLTNASITPGSLNPNLTGLDMSDFIINDADGVITFDWSNGQPCDVQGDINALSETLFPDDQVLFEMCFTASDFIRSFNQSLS